ncbi:MAG: molybdenum cofactor biosynthesis protein MoaE [Smithellaceae bacterium]|jgi:molybdopterin synthase catalytic subunit|nr:molybdenum cofactor biosynthesis protein MoaE [Smithellaceae bacterium]MDD3258223.1 molybdenum cofactor biosynthesis protein MoaE [Smithellaceae bacterium]MDD3849967.1 molybdenum cofactor biosynthesis protein MoaE [Smithellaceae bacterium]HOG12676.1 molybdenum cofactor biosynthesis protein MoaE [Smithellaceae bacterium]HOQ72428.1 molybdenum cofactor biosynthesis protein MoaE [Smithellaceae bacterium]
MVDEWIQEIKKKCPPDMLGMILVHNGVVRATSKKGGPVARMKLSYSRAALDEAVRRFKEREGIAEIRAWINEGTLGVGDDIMVVLVAGRFRTDVLPVFQELISLIKTEIVREDETS